MLLVCMITETNWHKKWSKNTACASTGMAWDIVLNSKALYIETNPQSEQHRWTTFLKDMLFRRLVLVFWILTQQAFNQWFSTAFNQWLSVSQTLLSVYINGKSMNSEFVEMSLWLIHHDISFIDFLKATLHNFSYLAPNEATNANVTKTLLKNYTANCEYQHKQQWIISQVVKNS